MIIEIEVSKRTEDYHACITDDPAYWGCGQTINEAIGDLVNAHADYFGINIELMEQNLK
jgi:hypothetical protein